MIETLTKDQEARFPEFIKKWTDIGLCTDPANRKEAERGIIMAYKAAKLPAPKIVWCGSPLSNGLTRALVLSKNNSVGASVWDSVGDSRKHLVLAHGESGHSHVIEDDEAELIQVGERMLLKLTKQATLVHEEHNKITLTPGIWEIGRVREYDWFHQMERQVID